MKRNITQLKDTHFDILIVGGGIHGATLALAATKSGYKTALVEKGDFGHATSANSLKIIHGGIRYLQHGDLKRMRESIISRREMMCFAPHLVKPQACLMPTYGHGLRGKEIMRIAFAMYDIIAFDRNRRINKSNHLPAGKSLSTAECRNNIPGISKKKLTGGAVWYDAIAKNSERLTLEYIKESAKHGGCMINYMQALSFKEKNNRRELLVQDILTNQKFPVSCSLVINAAGPEIGSLAHMDSNVGKQDWATAINIIVKKRLFPNYAVGLEGYTDYIDEDAVIKRGKRLFFFVPWQKKYTMIGTNYKPWTGSVDNFSVTVNEIEEMLSDINKIYPAGNLTINDVTFFHGGILPAKSIDFQKKDSVQLNKSSEIIFHKEKDKFNGLITIRSVKYTTAPYIAKQTIKAIQDKQLLANIKNNNLKHKFHEPTYPRIEEKHNYIKTHLQSVYGNNWYEVFPYIISSDANEKNNTVQISKEPLLFAGEIIYFIMEEMAHRLTDIVLRRTSVGSAECPPESVLEKIADIMANQLNWSKEEKALQLKDVKNYYAPVK